LENIYMLSATPPSLLSVSWGPFDSLASGAKIHVPDSAAVTAYQSATGWSKYASMIVTP